MDSTKFFNKLDGLGSFSCRTHKRLKRVMIQQDDAQWHSRYGHCLNGSYHFCRFLLEPEPVVHLIYYCRKDEVAGEPVRYRSNAHRPGRPRSFMGFRTASRRSRLK